MIFELFFCIVTIFSMHFFLPIYPLLKTSLEKVRCQPVDKLSECVLQISARLKSLAAYVIFQLREKTEVVGRLVRTVKEVAFSHLNQEIPAECVDYVLGFLRDVWAGRALS